MQRVLTSLTVIAVLLLPVAAASRPAPKSPPGPEKHKTKLVFHGIPRYSQGHAVQVGPDAFTPRAVNILPYCKTAKFVCNGGEIYRCRYHIPGSIQCRTGCEPNGNKCNQ